MRKGLKVFLAAGLLSLVCSFTALAGWEQQGDGKWKYRDEETGKYLKSGWYWLDGNHDGVSERYYFRNYVLDIYKGEWGGWTVDENGAWTVDGVVQVKTKDQDVINPDYCRDVRQLFVNTRNMIHVMCDLGNMVEGEDFYQLNNCPAGLGIAWDGYPPYIYGLTVRLSKNATIHYGISDREKEEHLVPNSTEYRTDTAAVFIDQMQNYLESNRVIGLSIVDVDENGYISECNATNYYRK